MKTLTMLGLLLLSSCTLVEEKEVNEVRGRWELDSYRFGRGNAFTIPSSEVYMFDFYSDEELEALGASCNNCEGEYRVASDGSISAVVSCTEAACDALPTYGHALNYARSYQLNGDTLSIIFEQRGEIGVLSFSSLN